MLKDGDRGERISIVNSLEDAQRNATSILTLINITRMMGSLEGDSGTYQCEVTNRLPRDAQVDSTNVTVLSKWTCT